MADLLDCEHIVHLSHGPYRATVLPAAGGRLASFEVGSDRQTILVGLRDKSFPAHEWPKAGAFPMLPFTNRMPPGGIRLGNRVFAFPQNLADALHGFGHRSVWSVTHATDDAVEMHMDARSHPDWPWPLSAIQRVRLSSSGLTIEIEIRNDGHATMPFAMGWHPYIAMAPAASHESLSFSAARRFELDPAGTAARSNRRAFFGMQRGETAAFADWTGPAEVWTGSGLRLAITCEGADSLVLHRPQVGHYLCVEPVTALPGHVGQGLPDPRWLVEPGESRRLTVRFGVSG